MLAVIAVGVRSGSLGRWAVGELVPQRPGRVRVEHLRGERQRALLLGLLGRSWPTFSRARGTCARCSAWASWAGGRPSTCSTPAGLAWTNRVPTALLYLGGTVVVGLVAVWLGLVAGRWVIVAASRAGRRPYTRKGDRG